MYRVVQTAVSQLELPFEFSKSLKLKNMTVTGSGGLKNARLEIQEEDGNATVLVTLKREDVARAGAFGVVRIADRASGATAE